MQRCNEGEEPRERARADRASRTRLMRDSWLVNETPAVPFYFSSDIVAISVFS